MDMAMIESWIIPSILTIAAVLALRLVLRGKISLRLQYALWAVVLVRLLLPFQIFVTPLSADALVEELDIPGTMQQAYVSANDGQYQQQYDSAYRDSVEYYESKGQQVDPVVADQRAAETARKSLVLELRLRLMNLWLLGMAGMALVITACNLHFALRLRRSRRDFPAADSLLPVYVTDAVPTPCVFGLFRPVIYLTPAAVEDETVLRHALTHELTHYRHLDHVWSVLRSLCLVLHWYNPLVWIAAKVSRADAELACDEGALRLLGEGQRFDYGRTLVGLTCGERLGSLFVTATTMTGSAGSLRERLKLLMKRPKTTALTLTALILVVTVIVGCTFSGAPEEPQATISQEVLDDLAEAIENGDVMMDFPEMPTETTAALPVDPATLFDTEGLLIYPGFEWFLTEEEVLARLGITAEDCLDYQKTSGEGMTANGFQIKSTGVFGVPMVLDFTFRSYWPDVEPVLTEVYATFENPADFEAVRALYTQVLGETDEKLTHGIEERWDGEISFRDVLGKEGYEILDYCADAGAALDHPASYVQWVTDNYMVWRTELPEVSDPVAEVAALFSEYGDPAYRAALLELYDVTDMEVKPFTMEELFVPEILEVVREDSGNVLMYYRRPGDFRRYAAQVHHSEEDGWYVLSNRIVVSMEDYAHLDPRALTEQELQQFRSHFNTFNLDGEINPAACFLLPYYQEIHEMDGSAFLAYFPTDQEGTEQDFDLLKAKYPEFFGHWTYETMPIPIHRYSAKEIEKVVSRYGNIHWQELSAGVHYLEETGCYYNYTSDFGLGGFQARSGFVFDGGAVVCSDFSALFFTETAGSYTIRAHLPISIG